MRKIQFPYSLVLLSILVALSGCASIGKQWKALISDQNAEQKQAQASHAPTTFSKQNNLIPSNYRKYKRTTRKDLEEDAHLEGKSGSLWVMEGQGAYLFSQNVMRMIGDPLAIRIEGDPAEQLTSKTKVIGKLLSQIEERRKRAMGRAPTSDKKDEAKPEEANKPDAAKAAAPNAGAEGDTAANDSGKDKDFGVKLVPTRVVERMVDGNYRVRGSQPFLIGSREYKVIVSGIVRAEDFNEEGISAQQLLDSNFDIVSSKSTEMR